MVGISIILLLVIGVATSCGLGVALFGLIYGVVNKRPGVAIASLFAPLMIAVAGLALLFGVRMRISRPAMQSAAATVTFPAVPTPPSPPTLPEPVQEVDAAEIKFKSMQELWEKLHQPRIQLESNAPVGETESTSNTLVSLQPPSAANTKVRVPLGSDVPESMARSLARLERVVDRVSAMADQVSDAGTLVGKSVVALSEALDAKKSSPPATEAAVPVVAAARAVSAKNVASPVASAAPLEPASTVQDISSHDAAPVIVELAIDQRKMNDYGVSERELFQALSKLGFQSGAFHVNNELRKVRAVGGPGTQSAADLMETVLAKVGVDEQPVRVRDIATSIGGTPPRQTASGTRPAWVDMPPKRVGNSQRRVVVAGDFTTREECDREADRMILLATGEHLATIVGINFPQGLASDDSRSHGLPVPSDPRWELLQRANVGLDFIRREITADEYEETVQMSFGPMKRLYTLLEFTPAVDAELAARWDACRREKRFALVGMGAGSVLGLLGMTFGLLKLDTLTKGYYSKRLFFGVPAAIIGGLTLLWLAVS